MRWLVRVAAALGALVLFHEANAQVCNKYVSLQCRPECFDPCPENANCIDPNVCQCDHGFSDEGQFCKPICEEACHNHNAFCSEPNVCTCLEGYGTLDVSGNMCEPLCSADCRGGICAAPGVCACGAGYGPDAVGGCAPLCQPPCGHGLCTSPNICMCFDGYVDHNNTCQPDCGHTCSYGTCIAPFTCECHKGYTRGNGTDDQACVPYCLNCSGKCVGPYKCVCEKPFEAVNMNVDGEICDCFDNNCTRKCDRTECVLETEMTTSDISTNEDNYKISLNENKHDESTVSFTIDNADEYATNIASTTDQTSVEFNTQSDNYGLTYIITEPINVYTSEEIENKSGRAPHAVGAPAWVTWVAIGGGCAGLVLLALLILLLKRKALQGFFKHGSYSVEYHNKRDGEPNTCIKIN